MPIRRHHIYLFGVILSMGFCSLIFAATQTSGGAKRTSGDAKKRTVSTQKLAVVQSAEALPWQSQKGITPPQALTLMPTMMIAKIASVATGPEAFGSVSAFPAQVQSGHLAAKLLISKLVHRTPNASSRIKGVISPYAPIGGGEVVLPVLASRTSGGRVWLEVPIDHRPNGNSGWITDDGTLPVRVHTKIIVNLSSRRLTLYRDGRVMLRVRAGIGAGATPTPVGTFPVVEILLQLQPSAIGPWALALAGYSNVLTDFNGGPGQIAIHGTDEPSSIGRAASHGCVHVTNSEDVYLAHTVELGTLVTIKR